MSERDLGKANAMIDAIFRELGIDSNYDQEKILEKIVTKGERDPKDLLKEIQELKGTEQKNFRPTDMAKVDSGRE